MVVVKDKSKFAMRMLILHLALFICVCLLSMYYILGRELTFIVSFAALLLAGSLLSTYVEFYWEVKER